MKSKVTCEMTRKNNDQDLLQDFKCNWCGEICEAVEETFDYSGTHCSGGKDGFHRTGNYLSSCCDAEVNSC